MEISDECDGKKCGLGKHIGGGHYLCEHNNLAAKKPELKIEWHADNNPMSEYSSSTLIKVWWKCSKNVDCNCHEWEASIANRTKKIKPSGCPYCSGIKFCEHNTLELKYPELVDEWHPDNGKISEYNPNSNKKVWWRCSKNKECECHVWQATISSRTGSKQSGCPFCYNGFCKHNNLETNYPDLINEWHPKNKPMCEYSPGSAKKVWWKCSKNINCDCHSWEAIIYTRTKNIPAGCPFCSKNNAKFCEHTNLKILYPSLINEWHPDNKQMSTYSPHSGNIVKWKCSKNKECDCHVWEMRIGDRTKNNPCGCPFCASQQLCDHNNLESMYPKLKLEWHSDNKQMNTYSPHSRDLVKWKCSKNKECDCHIWTTSIGNRTMAIHQTNCPFCLNKKLCSHNHLGAKYPKLKDEWHPNNEPIHLYPPGSSVKVEWKCKKNPDHEWTASISNRTAKSKNLRHRSTGCPHCCISRGYSYAQIDWIKEIETTENIIIRHALSKEGEFFIPKVGKVDGYCENTNTIYEYHGDYWHGNPAVFDECELNKTVKKTFGELYLKTIKRDQYIRDLGYNLVIKWETSS